MANIKNICESPTLPLWRKVTKFNAFSEQRNAIENAQTQGRNGFLPRRRNGGQVSVDFLYFQFLHQI